MCGILEMQGNTGICILKMRSPEMAGFDDGRPANYEKEGAA